jgi:DNA invertase Pin-like site-specific DNA recombinase
MNHSTITEILDELNGGMHTPPVRTAYSYRRISSPEQLKGAGLSRQVESAIAYCKQHNLRLDETLKLSDEGISAFKGDNVLWGKLGKFLELVDKGKIKKGSFLIVESIDRISRQNVLDAQELFLSIINRGITVVTLMDGQEYSRQEIQKNPWKLMVSISVMIRANEESETKSKRVTDARDKRREKATNGAQFKTYCPPWCDWENERFKLDPKKAAILKRIFKMYLDGKGPMAIAATLNDEGIMSFSRGTARSDIKSIKVWYKKLVTDLLKDKRLIGHAHFIDKDDYFPLAVGKDLFNQVQARMAGRKRKGGQIGTGPVNILAGMMYCGHCGAAIGKTRSVNREGYEYYYYVCENARSGKGNCKWKSILFDAVEQSFLYLMRFRPWFQEMMKDDGTLMNEFENRIEIFKGEQLDAEQQITKIVGLIEGDPNPSKAIVAKLKEWETRVENIKARLTIEEGRLLEHKAPPIDETFFEVLPAMMKGPDYRLKVKEVLGQMIKGIRLYTHGTKYPYYQIERTNGNFWSVVFEDTKRQSRAFQIFKGRVSQPYGEDEGEGDCELIERSNGKHSLKLIAPLGKGTG